MTITSISITTPKVAYIRYTNSGKVPPCIPYFAEAVRIGRYRRIVTDDTVRRIKPVWLNRNPTNLGTRYRGISYHSFALIQGTEDGHCKRQIHYELVYSAGSSLITYDFLDSHWALDLRLKLVTIQANLGSSLAEYRDTGRMFASWALALRNAKRRLTRLQHPLKRRRWNINDVGSAHLTMEWGVKPLADDVYRLYEELKNKIEEGNILHKTIRGKVPVEKTYVFNRTSDIITLECSLVEAYRVSVFLDAHHLITLGNPLSWAWEIIPFSFVVDYAINIGDNLLAIDALKGIDQIVGYRTKRQRTVVEQAQKSFPYISADQQAVTNEPMTQMFNHYTRYRVMGVPYEPKLIYSPSATWKRLSTSVSLLLAIRGRRR